MDDIKDLAKRVVKDYQMFECFREVIAKLVESELNKDELCFPGETEPFFYRCAYMHDGNYFSCWILDEHEKFLSYDPVKIDINKKCFSVEFISGIRDFLGKPCLDTLKKCLRKFALKMGFNESQINIK